VWTRRRAAAVETCRRPAFSRRCRQQASVRTTTTTTTTAPAAPYSRPTSTLPQPGPPTRSRFRQDHSRLLQVQSSCPSSCLGPGVEAFLDHSWSVLVLVWQNWFCLRHCFFITPLFNVSKLFFVCFIVSPYRCANDYCYLFAVKMFLRYVSRDVGSQYCLAM